MKCSDRFVQEKYGHADAEDRYQVYKNARFTGTQALHG